MNSATEPDHRTDRSCFRYDESIKTLLELTGSKTKPRRIACCVNRASDVVLHWAFADESVLSPVGIDQKLVGLDDS